MIEIDEPRPDLLFNLLSAGLRRIGKKNLLLGALLLSILTSLVTGLVATVRGLDGSLLALVSLAGAASAWVPARLRWKDLPALTLSLLLGVGLVVSRVASLGEEWIALLRLGNEWTTAALRWAPGLPPPETAALWNTAGELVQAAAILLLRFREWLLALSAGAPTYDLAAVALVWSLAVWVVSFWAAWEVHRARPLAGAFPAITLLAINLAYVREGAGHLLLILAATLGLMAVISYSASEQRWEQTGVDFPDDLRFDVALVAVPLVMGLTLLAAAATTISLQKIEDFFNELRPATISDSPTIPESFGLKPPLPQGTPGPLAKARYGGLPRGHLLGTGPELSEQIVMIISTGELPSGPPGMAPSRPVPNHYWRSAAYDRYSGRGWTAGPSRILNYSSGSFALDSMIDAGLNGTGVRALQQQVEIRGETNGLLVSAGLPTSVDQDYRLAWRSQPGEGPQTGSPLAAEIDLFAGQLAARRYRATSLLNTAGEEQLLSSGRDYPRWVRERYLELPESLPPRVLGLARDLTAAEPTPYEQALAIERYLRQIPYSLDLPPPPGEGDLVDYFLFDLKRGYCDYYATAMVVLARAVGLPARLVVGFASGSYDVSSAHYVVTAADAHSWPEVYFAGIGWIEFEPTGSRPLRGRDETVPTPPRPEVSQAPAERLSWKRILPALALGAALLALLPVLFLAVLLVDTWRLRFLPPSPAILALYRRLWGAGGRLAKVDAAGSKSAQDSEPQSRLISGASPADTPYEFAASLIRKLEALAGKRSRAAHFAPASDELRTLAEAYSRSIYSPHPPEQEEKYRAIQAWSRLRWRLLLARWWGRKQ